MAFIKTITINVEPNIEQDFVANGNILGLLNSTVPIYFKNFLDGSEFFLEKGQELQVLNGSNFERFKIWHNDAGNQSITVAIGKNATIKQSKSLNEVVASTPLQTKDVSPNVLTSRIDVSIPATTTQLILAAAGGTVFKREVIIKNLTNNTEAFRVGGAGTDATHGVELQAGESLTIQTRADIYAYNFGAIAQNISVLTNEL